MSEWQEEDIVRRCQAKDEAAFTVLIKEYGNVLYGTAYLMVRDKEMAQDAVQEALIRIWKHLPSFRFKSSIKTWLVRIVINEVKQQRRKKHVPTVPLQNVPQISDDVAGIETVLFRNCEYRHLERALKMLSEDQREAVVLRYYSGFTVPEVAGVTGEREGTIKSRLSRALDRLEEILGKDELFQNGRTW